MAEQPIETLVAQAQALDGSPLRRQEAFGALVERFQDVAYGYAYALLGDPHLAQDAAQEAFLAAYRHVHQLREASAFAAWFRRIVRTQCTRLRRGKELPPLPLETLDAPGAVAAASLGRSSAASDPSALAEERERQALVATVLQELPAHERIAVVLFYVSGYPQAEIAGLLGVPVNTVKKRLQSARKRLQERMLAMMDDALSEHGRAHLPSRDERFVETIRFLTALEDAAAEGEVPLVELLLVDGVDVNAQDADGRTLLSLAAQRGHADAVEFLLRQGADVNAPDRAGRTPLAWAERAGHRAVAALLRRHSGAR